MEQHLAQQNPKKKTEKMDRDNPAEPPGQMTQLWLLAIYCRQAYRQNLLIYGTFMIACITSFVIDQIQVKG